MMARIKLVSSDMVKMKLVRGSDLKPPAKRKRAVNRHPDRESQFLKLLKQFGPGIAEPVRQFVFHKKRKFRFDFAWTDCLVAVEIDGGIDGNYQSEAARRRDLTKVREHLTGQRNGV
jgi:hypothetical protein